METKSQLEYQQMQSKDKLQYLQKLTDDQLYDEANRLLKVLLEEEKSNPQLVSEADKICLQKIKKDIEDTISDMNFQLDEMKNAEHTDSHRINENLTISFKIFEKTNTVTIRAQADLDIPWFNLVALVYEIDLFKNWFPFCKHAETIKKPKKGEKIGYFEMNLPFISNRDAYITGMGIDRLEENGTILIKCKTIHDEPELLKSLNIDLSAKKNVQVQLNFFACEIFPVPGFKNKVKITTISNVDPKVKFLPKWMLNFFAKKVNNQKENKYFRYFNINQFGTYLMEKMLRLAQDIKGTEWEKAINAPENQVFYKWVQERVDMHEQKVQNNQVSQMKDNQK